MNINDLKGASLDTLSDEFGEMSAQVFEATEGRHRVISLVYDKEGEMHIVGGEKIRGMVGILLSAAGMEATKHELLSKEGILALSYVTKELAGGVKNARATTLTGLIDTALKQHRAENSKEVDELLALAAKEGDLSKQDKQRVDYLLETLMDRIKAKHGKG